MQAICKPTSSQPWLMSFVHLLTLCMVTLISPSWESQVNSMNSSANLCNERVPAASISMPSSKIYCLSHGLRSEEHTSELQSHSDLVCRLLLEKKKRQSREFLMDRASLRVRCAQ